MAASPWARGWSLAVTPKSILPPPRTPECGRSRHLRTVRRVSGEGKFMSLSVDQRLLGRRREQGLGCRGIVGSRGSDSPELSGAFLFSGNVWLISWVGSGGSA